MKTKLQIGLLPRVIIAIILGLLTGRILPEWSVRIFVTFNDLFSQFLSFSIPLIILGLVAPGIADMGKRAGKLLALTVVLAYGFTLFSGFFTYFSCEAIFSKILSPESLSNIDTADPGANMATAYFFIEMPPVFGVMTALILASILGMGISTGKGNTLRIILMEFNGIIEKLITKVIIPILPLFIFGIFLNMSFSGAAFQIISLFGKVIVVIFILHILLLIIMFAIAGTIGKKNPFKLLYTMLPAYMTALGSSSSAATIPVTLNQVKKLGVDGDVADFCVPLCATIHLSGSTMKIVAMSLAICIMTELPHDLLLYAGFICMLGIMMIAAPGVPGGAIMASIAVLQSILHFDEMAIGLMIALYIAIDSFGTACNVTGDGAIAIIVDRFLKRDRSAENSTS
ncbi:MAG: dicarboxylate/amino acid:cation symporter [Bacteroidales bacterium]|jgi:Na+/H+-dicarboxylate symporter|nr:dicarboxylate/amino acid:cation symporter [Bacteroidales bacterium]